MKKQVRNADYTKQYNRKMILKLLLKSPSSRAELARDTGLTKASVSIMVDELLKNKILLELDCENSSRGRKPTPLSVNPNAFFSFGLFLNREICKVGIVGIGGQCTELLSLSNVIEYPAHTVIQMACDAMNDYCNEHPRISKKILGVGISCPGRLDLPQGIILNPPGFEAWHDFPICDEITNKTGLPSFACDNADALALYNLRYGCCKNLSDFLLLLVDTGIGSGIVMKNKIYHGAGNVSPELGHVSIQYMGRQCGCGNKGCLEAYAAIPMLLKGSPYSNYGELIFHVKNKNDAALALLSEEATYLSTAILTALNMFDLKTVCLAGDIIEDFEFFSEMLHERINPVLAEQKKAPIQLLCSDVSEHYEIISGANVLFSSYLDSSSLILPGL